MELRFSLFNLIISSCSGDFVKTLYFRSEIDIEIRVSNRADLGFYDCIRLPYLTLKFQSFQL